MVPMDRATGTAVAREQHFGRRPALLRPLRPLLLLLGARPCSAEAAEGGGAEADGGCDPDKIFALPVSEECPTKPGSVDWSAFSGELYDARNLIMGFSLHVARAKLAALVHLAMSNAAAALSCPAGPAAACHSLAQALAAEGRTRGHALALLHLAVTLLPHRTHRECSQWPLQGRELSFAFLGLLPAPVANVASEAATRRLRVAVVTACGGVHDGAARALSEENRRAYAALHGYGLHFFPSASAVLTGWRPLSGANASDAPAFWRALAVQRVLEGPERYDWALWLDCEALITEPARPAEELLAAGGVRAEGGEVSLLMSANGLGAQAEAWLMRPSPWSLRFLRRWTSRVPGLSAAALGEGAALRHALLPHWEAWLRGGALENWEEVTWPAEVRLAPPGALLSQESPEPAYLPAPRTWREGDFAWHDSSCRRGGGVGKGQAAVQLEACLRRMVLAESIFARKIQ